MKILFISDFFQPYSNGAASISTYVIAKKLSENNECYIVTQQFEKKPWVYDGLTVNPQLPKFYPDKGIKNIILFELSSLLYFKNVFAFRRIISDLCQTKKIDVIQVQSNNMALLITLLLLNKPVVIDVRDYYLTCPFMLQTVKCDRNHLFCIPSHGTKQGNWSGRFLSILFFRYQTFTYFIEKNLIFKPLLSLRRKRCVFVANSHYVKETLVKEFSHYNIDIRVIYNPINTNDYGDQLHDREKIVLYASSIEKAKGIWDCIHAFEKCDKNIIFKIAGDGPEFDAVRDYIQNKHLTNIILLGKLGYKDMPALYKEAYVTVQPSVWPEPFGRFILESFASGTPLITTPTGGTTEAVRDGETGILVPPNDPGKITEAITRLFNDKELYKHIRQHAAGEAKKYHPDLIARQRIELYREMISMFS